MTARVDQRRRITDVPRPATGTRTMVLAAVCATVLVAVTTAFADVAPSTVLGLTVGTALLGSAAVVDVQRLRLPNALVLTAGAVGIVIAVADARLGESVMAVCIASVPLLVLHLVDRRAFGFGDVKFAAAAGALVGCVWAPAAILVPLTALVVAGITRLGAPDGARPFGPPLLGGLATAVVAATIVETSGWVS